MDLKEVNSLSIDIEKHWYYQAKAKALMRLTSHISPSVILDVGAGSAFFSRKLLSQTSAKEAWCVDINYESEHDIIEAGKPIHFRRDIHSINADLVLLMDVIEHVDDDVGLLRQYVEKVPRGTHFLISVPAFQFLWSRHDIFLEHKRRYRLSQLEAVVKSACLDLCQGSYYFGAVFPIAATLRLINNIVERNRHKSHSQLRQHSHFVNDALALVSAAELRLIRHNRFAGLTAFCLAKKP